jgi:EmrB/QacA subfamily drug resistance transporter
MSVGSLAAPAVRDRRRWLALYVECLGVFMILLDGTIVNVALASIKVDLGIPEQSLVWVVSGYLIPYGGCLLLGGRLGDCYGRRSMFLGGVALFSCASLVCGLAGTEAILVAARALQGLGAAVVLAVGFSLILSQFEEPSERIRAMAIYSLACASGGGVGVMLGGLLTQALGWRWIFFVNVPVGAAVCILFAILVPRPIPGASGPSSRLDIGGAITITGSLVLAAYAALTFPQVGKVSPAIALAVLAAGTLLLLFTLIEASVRTPLIPLQFFSNKAFSLALLAGVLWAAAQQAWFYLCALYLHQVLGYGPLAVGLAFLPVNGLIGILASGACVRLIMRWDLRVPIFLGLLLCASGLLWFSRTPLEASFVSGVLPGMVLIGLGTGLAYNPLVISAVRGVGQSDYGAASGVLNSAFVMTAAVSIAFLASLASSGTNRLLAAATPLPSALNSGYHLSFEVGAALASVAAIVSTLLPTLRRDPVLEHQR